MTDPAAVRREAMEEAARIADRRQTKLEAKGSRHPDNSPSREACAQGAYEAMWLGKAIREAASRPAGPVPNGALWQLMHENAVAALAMIREAVETLFGPVASLESPEAVLLRGPEPTDEAEAIITALGRIKGKAAEATGDAERVAEMEGKIALLEHIISCRDKQLTKETDLSAKFAAEVLMRRTRVDAAEARACAAHVEIARLMREVAHVEVARLMREVERQRNRSDAAEQDYNAAAEAFRSGLGPAEARAQAAEAEAGRLRAAARTLVERANEVEVEFWPITQRDLDGLCDTGSAPAEPAADRDGGGGE